MSRILQKTRKQIKKQKKNMERTKKTNPGPQRSHSAFWASCFFFFFFFFSCLLSPSPSLLFSSVLSFFSVSVVFFSQHLCLFCLCLRFAFLPFLPCAALLFAFVLSLSLSLSLCSYFFSSFAFMFCGRFLLPFDPFLPSPPSPLSVAVFPSLRTDIE